MKPSDTNRPGVGTCIRLAATAAVLLAAIPGREAPRRDSIAASRACPLLVSSAPPLRSRDPSAPPAAGQSHHSSPRRSGVGSPSARPRTPLDFLLDRAEEVDREEVRLAEPNVLCRARLLRTSLKYPSIRVEETIRTDPGTGLERVVRRSAMVADHILVRLNEGVDEADLRAASERLGATIRKRLLFPRTFLVAFSGATVSSVPRFVEEYGRDAALTSVAEPDYLVWIDTTTPNDPYYYDLWGLRQIAMPQAWDLTRGSGNVVVGVIDTGIDYDHEDLAGNLWVNPGENPFNSVDDDGNGFVDDAYGWDFYQNDADPDDTTVGGHGTHVAGTIGALGNNGVGVAGVCWRVQLMALRFVGNDDLGLTSDAIEAVRYATMMRERGVNIRLTSNSWGGEDASSVLRQAIEASGRSGMLFVAASGNDGLDNDITPHYPSSYELENVISVANSERNDELRYSSNYGVTSVDLAAPGVDTRSTLPGSAYGQKTGTSMATPHVAGVAALLWDLRPDASWQEVREAIFSGVDRVPALNGMLVTGGRLNGRSAMLRLNVRIDHEPLGNTTNTSAPVEVTARIAPASLVDGTRTWIYWNTTGRTNAFTASRLGLVSNDLFRGAIPPPSLGSTVWYYLSAQTVGGLTARHPSTAPAQLHAFRIVRPVTLTVTGTPVQAGTPSPSYGRHAFPSGVTVRVWAPTRTEPVQGVRHALVGWAGAGDMPASGATNAAAFELGTDTAVDWQWTAQYALLQTSTVQGIVSTTTWWNADAAAETVTAPTYGSAGGSTYGFAGWRLDGQRQPDATNVAANPVLSIAMAAPRCVQAVYLPENQDLDGDALGDWWEQFHFGGLSAGAGADPDGDVFTNLAEYLDRTNPRNAAAFPAPPAIVHVPLPDPLGRPGPYEVLARVTDNFRVAAVSLDWQQAVAPFVTTGMAASAQPGVYRAFIPAPSTNGTRFAYRIRALDPAGWAATSGVHRFRTAYPVADLHPSNGLQTLSSPGAVTYRSLAVTNLGMADLSWRAWTASVEGFEQDPDRWTHHGTNDLWHLSSRRAASGRRAWYCGYESQAKYTDSMNASLVMPAVRLAAGSRLLFRHWARTEYDTEQNDDHYWDGGIVEISTNAGVLFDPVFPDGGYPHRITENPASPFAPETPCFGSTAGWEQESFDLSSYSNREAVIRFRFGSDRYTVEEGWYIDDVVVAPSGAASEWLRAWPSNGVLPARMATNVTVAFDARNTVSGDREGFVTVESNDPVSPVQTLPVSMKVRSPPVLALTFAAHTATNGMGYVTVSNRVADVDQEDCDLEVVYSVDRGQSWRPAWIARATAVSGSPVISNQTPRAVRGIATRGAQGPVTNRVTVTWASANGPYPLVLATDTLVRVRAWDGGQWSVPAVSAPFRVDNEPPTPPTALTVLSHRTHAWSSTNTIRFSWGESTDGNGGGLAGYGYKVTDEPALDPPLGVNAAGRSAAVADLRGDANWWVLVRAFDRYGNASASASNGPFRIDATAPDARAATVRIAGSEFGRYSIGPRVTAAWSGFREDASPIEGYYYATRNGGGTTNGVWVTGTSAVIPGLPEGRTNTLYVWARNAAGLAGSAASGSFLLLDPAGDYDADGLRTEDEETSGTDATDARDVFGFLAFGHGAPTSGATFIVLWPTAFGRLYTAETLDTTPDAAWTPVPGFINMLGSGSWMSFTDDITRVESRLYRVRVRKP